MSRYYQRPENALKKANEFIEVEKPTRALDTLYDVIKGKKHRAFSEKVIEPIMLKYLELCVELKKPHTAKEGLYQYRLMCQSVNVGLLEKVIRSYIRMAEEKTEKARAALKKEVVEQSTEAIVEVDDLDNLSMAEMTLLNVITEEQAQERSDRAALIPWVKFLWESYTQCLDLLRNNARLENLYHDIAQMAFKFCLSYSRKTEFRKLCERLRKHFDDIVNRQGSQMNSIDFSSPETQQLNMETRLAQLDSAITLELWQEAYKAIEDIHLLMNQSKKSQTRMMAYYYQKLSLVFWKAGNLLFHAATLLKYYMLCKDMKKNVSASELQKNASQVALATLAIPFPVVHPEFERFVETDKGMMEKSQKLATLLFLPQPPTRASLIRDLMRFGVLNNAITPLHELYEVLETQFNPLELCSSVDGILTKFATFEDTDYLQQYVEPLQDVALVRLIKQISQVYQTIDYNHLLGMTIFATQTRVEQLLVDAVRFNDMQINIDHRSNCIKFGASLAEASREDLPEGPHLQAMPSEAVRLQLVNVVNFIDETIETISPLHIQIDEDKIRSKIVNHYLMTERQSHVALLQRQKIIADRREELERSAADRENEEKWRTEQMMKQQMLNEAKRLENEREEREKKRIETERRKINEARAAERFALLKNSPLGAKVYNRMEEDDLTKMDVEMVLLKQQEEMAKEAKEQLARLKSQDKRLDHLERAKRQEEIEVIKQYVEEKKEQEKNEWEAHELERIEHLIEERKIAVATRDRMKRMKEEKNKFLAALLDARKEIFQEKLRKFDETLEKIKVERLYERKEKRKEDRYLKHKQAIEEEERRRQDEIRHVEEERMREERDRIAKELEEKNKATLEKQLAKQREIEEREERDRRAGVVPEKPAVEPWRPSSKPNPETVAAEPWRHASKQNPNPETVAAEPWRHASKVSAEKATGGEVGKPWVPRNLAAKKAQDDSWRRDGHGERDAGRGERDVGRGERDVGRGERDVGRGERDVGRGERDFGRGERDFGRGERDTGRGERDAGRGDRDAGRGDRDAGRGERDAGSGAGRATGSSATPGLWRDDRDRRGGGGEREFRGRDNNERDDRDSRWVSGGGEREFRGRDNNERDDRDGRGGGREFRGRDNNEGFNNPEPDNWRHVPKKEEVSSAPPRSNK